MKPPPHIPPPCNCCWKSSLAETSYQLQDPKGEEEHNFRLTDSIKRAKKPVLRDILVFMSDNVKSQPDLKRIIEVAGGKVVTSLSAQQGDETLAVISCPEDASWQKKTSREYPSLQFYSHELILTSILKQELDLASFLLP